MKKTYYTLIGTFFCSLFFAQQNSIQLEGAKIDFKSSHTNLPLQVTFDDSKHLPEISFNEWMKKDMVKSNDAAFVKTKTEVDPLGFTHNRFQQFYKGYKIDGAIIISHNKNKEVKSFNGDWYNNVSMSNTISLTEKQALQYALNKVNAKKYKWENKDEEIHMQKTLNNPNFNYSPIGELCILPLIDAKTKIVSFQYAYKFNIYAEEPLYRANLFIDATSGKTLKEHNLICTIDAVGSANTKYSGTKPITTDSYTAGYRLR